MKQMIAATIVKPIAVPVIFWDVAEAKTIFSP